MAHATITKVLETALGEVGYLEKATGNPLYLESKTANAGGNNYTKYGRDLHKVQPKNMDYPAPWCDCFVDWCVWHSTGKDLAKTKKILCGDLDDYTVYSAQRYKDEKRWHTSAPKKGDQIFFKDSKGGICHTGLVYKVGGSTVYTVEGNTSNASGVVANGGGVAKKSYSTSFDRIAGYGRPHYEYLWGYKTKVTRYLYPNPKKQTSKRICKIPKGAEVEYLGEKSGNWRKVRYKGKTGWMGVKSAGITVVSTVYKYR